MTTDKLKELALAAKAATADMEWIAQMSRLHLTASPRGSTCLNDEVTLALCATGEHVYSVLPYLAAANPSAILDLIRERDEARNNLLGLLAVIHRDGGHHTEAVGLRQSVQDAFLVWAALISRAEAAEAALSAAREEVEKVRAALADYHAALKNREHGGVAAGRFVDAVTEALTKETPHAD